MATFTLPGRADDLSARIARIEETIAADPVGRHIAALVCPGSLELAARSLLSAEHAIIVSGFVPPPFLACETDGPAGALALGQALETLRIPVSYLTDPFCLPVFVSAGLTPVFCFRPDLGQQLRPSHWVAIERPGRASDGKYYSMRGLELNSAANGVDALFLDAARFGSVTIGIGDGGNEIGMGKVCDRVRQVVPHGDRIASVVSTDHLIVSGTSNWGAWGLVAAMQLLVGRPLLPDRQTAANQLLATVKAGAMDGVTGESIPTVDSLGDESYLFIVDELQRIVSVG